MMLAFLFNSAQKQAASISIVLVIPTALLSTIFASIINASMKAGPNSTRLMPQLPQPVWNPVEHSSSFGSQHP